MPVTAIQPETTNNNQAGVTDVGREALAVLAGRRIEIEAMAKEFAGLTCEDSTKYEMTRVAIGRLRTLRVDVEKRRKELKASALEWGRLVDKTAAELQEYVYSIERPLQALKDEVDTRKEREKKAKEEAERQAIIAEEERKRAEQRAKDEAEAAERAEKLRVENERLEKLAKEQKAERDRLDAERKQIEEARRAHMEQVERERKAAQDKLDAAKREEEVRAAEVRRQEKARLDEHERQMAEQRRIAEQKAREEREKLEADRQKFLEEQRAAQVREAERLERIRQEQEAKDRAEREAKEQAEREAAEKARFERLAPDRDKVYAFAEKIDNFLLANAPKCSEQEAKVVIEEALTVIGGVALKLIDFANKE